MYTKKKIYFWLINQQYLIMKPQIALLISLLFITNAHSQTNSRFKIVQKNMMDGTRVGVTDLNGKEIIPASYDKILGDVDGKFLIIKDNRLGYADTTGKVIIPVQYLDGTYFNSNRAFVITAAKKWAMINANGKLLTQAIYDDVGSAMSEGIGQVAIAGKIGYVNSEGVQIIPCKYPKGFDCYKGLILVKTTYKEAFGQATVKGQKVNYYMNGDVTIVYNTKGVIVYKGQQEERIKITPTGKIFATMTFNSPGNFSPPSYSQIVDGTGKILLSYESHYYLTMVDYWLKVESSDHKVGIMDFDGNILLKPNFKTFDQYRNYNGKELAKVYFMDNTFFYINTDGKCVENDGVKCPQ